MPQHINFLLRKCVYDSSHCAEEPIYYLIFGCLNQHLMEGAICQTHAERWARHQQDHDLACQDCGMDIEEYLILSAGLLT
jgi:hypothetical protein